MIDTIAQGAVMGLVNGAINQHFTDENRQKDFENWQIGRRQNFADAQRAQIAAPYNTKIGMMIAGLNPVTMTTPTTPTPASTPQGTRQNNPIDIAATTQMMADAKLKESEAEKIDLQNDITRGENEAAQNTYLEWSGQIVELLRKSGFENAATTVENDIDQILKNGDKVNVGHMRGAIEAFKTYDAMQQRIFDTLDKILSTKEVIDKLNNNAAHDMAQMPRLQRELTEKYIATQTSLAAYLASGEKVNKERVNEIKKNLERMDGEISLMVEQGKLSKAQADQIRNTDWKSLLYDGEVAKAAIAGGEKAAGKILEIAPQFIGAKGLVKTGTALTKNVTSQGQKNIMDKGIGTRTIETFDAQGKLKSVKKIKDTHNSNRSSKFDGVAETLQQSNFD